MSRDEGYTTANLEVKYSMNRDKGYTPVYLELKYEQG